MMSSFVEIIYSLVRTRHRLELNNINKPISACLKESLIGRKVNMLSTIVLSLLAIWLSVVIIGQLIGFGVGYSIYKSLSTPEKNGK